MGGVLRPTDVAGQRSNPTGDGGSRRRPVALRNASEPEERQSFDLLADFFSRIGVELKPSYNNWPEFLKKMERKQQQMFRLGWVADYPDAENFLQLFTTKSVSPGPKHTNSRHP